MGQRKAEKEKSLQQYEHTENEQINSESNNEETVVQSNINNEETGAAEYAEAAGETGGAGFTGEYEDTEEPMA